MASSYSLRNLPPHPTGPLSQKRMRPVRCGGLFQTISAANHQRSAPRFNSRFDDAQIGPPACPYFAATAEGASHHRRLRVRQRQTVTSAPT